MNKIIINDFAPLADKYAVIPAAGSSPYQKCGELLNSNARELLNYASLTGEGINLTDDSLFFADENNNIGYISSACSDASKELNPSVDIVIDLSSSGFEFSSPGITFHFWKNYCIDFAVKWFNNDTLLKERNFYPLFIEKVKGSEIFSYFAEENVENYNKIIISFNKTEIPNQFVKLAGIDLGKIREITDFHSNIEIFTEINPDCADVPGSTCDFVAEITDFKPQDMQALYVHGGKDEKLFGKFIIDRAPSIGRNRYSFECSDEIMKSDKSPHPIVESGTNSASFYAEKIKESSNIEIDCGAYADIQLKGFIEKGKSARMAAAMLSFGTGCFLTGFGSRMLKLCKPKNRHNKVISSDRILGRAEYTPTSPYTEIVVNQYNSSFDSVYTTRTEKNNNRKSTDIYNPLSFDQYSLMSDIDNRMNELKEAGFRRNEITARIIYDDEMLGDICSIETPYDGIKTGIIKSLGISIGNRITATVKMIERDYTSEGD